MVDADASPALVLIGAPGSGKTKIGKRVARRLGLPLVDTDKRFVARFGPIAEYFTSHGEAAFRGHEREEVEAALRERCVLSLGGGAVIDADSQRDLAGLRVVRLTVSPEAVLARIGGGKRPLLTDGIESWVRLVAEREPIYAALADRTWDTSARPLEQIAEEIADWVNAEDDLVAPGTVEADIDIDDEEEEE